MNIEQAIAKMEVRYPTCRRGDTAQPGHQYYEAARQLDFHACSCAANDPTYGGLEFVAVGPTGGGHYIGVYKKIGKITCGPKGYHSRYQKGTPICNAASG
jgi:hypothetical protein